VRSLASTALRSLFDSLLVPSCLDCGDLVPSLSPFDFPVCAACAEGFERILPPACGRCGVPLPAAARAAVRCGPCRTHPPDFRRAAAAFVYGGPVARIVLRLKYGREAWLAPPLGRVLAAAAHASGLGAATAAGAVVVAVPLAPARLRSRGYNQAVLLGRAAARTLGLPLAADALARARDPGPQDHHGRRERRERVAGCFAVTTRGARVVEGRPVLLVDDVITTGATASECARVLLAAGAASVDVIAVARAVS